MLHGMISYAQIITFQFTNSMITMYSNIVFPVGNNRMKIFHFSFSMFHNECSKKCSKFISRQCIVFGTCLLDQWQSRVVHRDIISMPWCKIMDAPKTPGWGAGLTRQGVKFNFVHVEHAARQAACGGTRIGPGPAEWDEAT